MNGTLISHICTLAKPMNERRYKGYLATLPPDALKQKLADLITEQHKAPKDPMRFWRVKDFPAAEQISLLDCSEHQQKEQK